ncbi:hypothetical protein FLL45_19590, partial [Aliikangiella marina]
MKLFSRVLLMALSVLVVVPVFNASAYVRFEIPELTPVPSTPQKVIVPTTNSTGNFTLSWQSSSNFTLGYYRVEESYNFSSWRSTGSNVSQSTTTKSFTGKLPGTYRFRVIACNSAFNTSDVCSGWGYSGYINVSSGQTAPSTPAVPLGPESSDNGNYTISWVKPSGTVSYYNLQERFNSGSWTTVVSSNVLSKSFSGKAPGNYQYRVRACNSAASSPCSSYSATKQLTVNNPELIPDATLITPSVPSQQAIGALEGQAGVSGGAATYSIPVAVPPGRAGMQPSVSIGYSSREGNGVAGIGWNLNVGGSVSRCAATMAQDGYARSVRLDNTDKLCLNGQKLVLVSGLYGQGGSEYRTELDSFARVTLNSASIGSSSSWFKVESKDGKVSYYGNTSNSKHYLGNSSIIMSWALSKVEDRTVKKNNMIFTYSEHGVGEYLMSKVEYTGENGYAGNRSVTFGYSTRPDKAHSYMAGYKSEQTKRLTTVNTYYASQLVRRYTLSYGATSSASGRTLLRSVTECAYKNSSPACLPATTFDWHEPTLGFTNQMANISGFDARTNDQIIFGPDTDGDGEKTLIYKSGLQFKTIKLDKSLNEITAKTRVSTAYGEGRDDIFLKNFSSPLAFSIDINRDGKPDYDASSNGKKALIYDDDGVSKLAVTSIPQEMTTEVGDLNGDGISDFYRHYTVGTKNTDTRVVVYYSCNTQPLITYCDQEEIYDPVDDWAANQFTDPNKIVAYIGETVSVAGDIDGNGLTDIWVLDYRGHKTHLLLLDRVSPTANLTVAKTAVSAINFNVPTNSASPHYHQFLDMNGDGLQDVLYPINDIWYYQINNGDGFNSAVNTGKNFNLTSACPVGFPGEICPGNPLRNDYQDYGFTPYNYKIPDVPYGAHFRVADIDNDGRDELLVPGEHLKTYCIDPIGSADDTIGTERNCSLHEFPWLQNHLVQWNYIDFDEGTAGVFSLNLQSTNIEARLNNLAFADVHGDGVMDAYSTVGFTWNNGQHVNGTENGLNIARNNSARPADMMVAVENGLGVKSKWNYKPLSDFVDSTGELTIYDPERLYADKHDDMFLFSSSMIVVDQFKQSNGGPTDTPSCSNDSCFSTTSYQYRGAIYNHLGRGFQGFRSIIVDSPAGIRSVTDFHQKFPHAGQIETVKTCLTSSNDDTCSISKLSETQMGYAKIDTTGRGTYWTPTAKSIASTYELNGGELVSQKTSYIGLSDPGALSTQMSINSLEAEFAYGNIKQSTSKVDSGFGVNETQTVNTFYSPSTSVWWINKLKSTAVTTKALSSGTTQNPVYNSSLDGNKTVTSYIDQYDSQGSRLPSTTRTVPSSGKTSKVISVYNSYGLPTSVTSQADGQNRTVTTSYSSDNYFVASVTNIDGTDYTNSNPTHGQPNSTTDINGLVSYFDYDNFGRIEKATPPSGTGQPVYTRFASCNQGCDGISDAKLVYKVTSYSAGTPQSSAYKDKFNRTLYTRTQGFDGSSIYTNVRYDELGRKLFESVPSRFANGLYGTEYLQYDVTGRLLRKVVDQTAGQTLDVQYAYGASAGSSLSPYRTRIVVNNDQPMYRTYSGTGQLMRTTDAKGGVTRYAYDGMGNPIVLNDAAGSSITATYNALGQKLWVNDPNMGRKDFSYTGFGEVEWETDAENNTYYYFYDGLSRLTHRYLNGTTSSQLEASFSFNTAACKAVPNSETRHDLPSGENFSRVYQYDDYCRPTGTVTNIDGDTFESTVFYDGNYGRVKGKQYPNDLVVAYEFNSYGYNNRTKNALDNTVYRQITAMDDWGNWTEASMGVYSRVSRQFHAQTGQMKHSKLKRYSSERQSVVYDSYDAYGNLTKQTVGGYGGSTYYVDSETYGYDELHRLIRSTLSLSGATQPYVEYGYDAVGNIKFKTDFSSASTSAYRVGNVAKNAGGNAGPNAVRQVLMKNGSYRNYLYDNNGNLENDGVRNIKYNAFNKPTQITVAQNSRLHPSDSSTSPGGTLRFSYGADQMRYKQVKTSGSNTTTTIYIDKEYERVTENGQTTHKAYVDDIAVVSQAAGSSSKTTTYFHRDRLGSMIATVNSSGYVIKGHSYDPFGKPRDQRMRDNAYSQVSTNIL